MKVKAQIGMVLNLDKCIGCHTCSVTCKNTWTNRPGAEYMWFNNVELSQVLDILNAGKMKNIIAVDGN